MTGGSQINENPGNLPGGLVLELGPGQNPQVSGAVGIDRSFRSSAGLIADLEHGLGFLADNSVDEIHSHHFLEHIEDLDQLLLECYRVLRPGGIFSGSVPHFSNPYFYSDPTHRRSFGLYTFAYYCDVRMFKREVPRYVPTRFLCCEMRIRFISPFWLRKWIKKGIERAVNFNLATMEFYEENLCFILPAFELAFTLKKPA